MTTPNSYDPEFVEVAGFGQTTGNPEPSTFIESIAINKDCSVYQNLFVGQNATIQKILRVGGGIFASGTMNGGSSLNISGPGNFGGVVSAAGFRFGRNSFGGGSGFVIDSPATFLSTLTTAKATSTFNGLVDAAKGLAAKALSVAPISLGFDPNNISQDLSDGVSPYYFPTNIYQERVETPIPFVPCYLNRLPDDAIVLAYIPSLNPLPN